MGYAGLVDRYPLVARILIKESMNSQMVSRLQPRNNPMLPPISPDEEIEELNKNRVD